MSVLPTLSHINMITTLWLFNAGKTPPTAIAAA